MVILKKQPLSLSFVLFVAALCFSWLGISLYAFMAFSFRMYAKIHNLLVWIDSASFNHFVPLSVCDTAVFRSKLLYWIYDHLLWGHFTLISLITADSIVLYHVHTKKYAINSTGTMTYIFICIWRHCNGCVVIAALWCQWGPGNCKISIMCTIK